MSEAPAVARARRGGAMPMAELHCHIEGAAHPDLVQAHAARHGIDVSFIIRDGRYVWHDFTSFLAAYDLASSVFRTEADYADLAADHLGRLAAQGAIYAEFFISPDHADAAGLPPEAYVAGLSHGIEQARNDSGIEARMVCVGVRHLGPAAVERAARFAARPNHPLVTGFGLAGDERVGAPSDFARAFAVARDAGLGLTAHAGELCGPESVRATLDALEPSRIGHGVRAVEDPDLVQRIVGEGIVLEICPRSNIALGVYPDAASHPLKRLVSVGARVTLNSDDPPFFQTTLTDEYAFAAEAGMDAGTRLGFTRQAIEAAFVDEATRRRLLDRLGLAAIALGAPAAGG